MKKMCKRKRGDRVCEKEKNEKNKEKKVAEVCGKDE
jgi:hypothetical protein